MILLWHYLEKKKKSKALSLPLFQPKVLAKNISEWLVLVNHHYLLRLP